MAPPPEVVELNDEAVWAAHCAGADGVKPKKLCVIGFLPNILDSKAAGRNAYIKSMQKAADAHKDKAGFAYLWAEGGAQGAVESALDVGGFGYPALVAYRPGDKKASVCKVRPQHSTSQHVAACKLHIPKWRCRACMRA